MAEAEHQSAGEPEALQTDSLPLQPVEAIAPLLRALAPRPLTRGELADALHLRRGSGNMANRVLAARSYGGLETVGSRYEITSLGLRLLSNDAAEAEAAYAEAIDSVSAFRAIRSRIGPERSVEDIEALLVRPDLPEARRRKAAIALHRSCRRTSLLSVPGYKRAAPEPTAMPPGVEKARSAAVALPEDASEAAPRGLEASERRVLELLFERMPVKGAPLQERAKFLSAVVGWLEVIRPGEGRAYVATEPGP